jgi:serine/threonine protein kinase
VLIDFGAARQTLTQEESKLQPMYTPGFAAPEQYHNRERLGPWTDIYSVGASLYACLAGYPPQAADARLLNDKLVPAVENWRGRLLRAVAGNHRPVPQAQLHGAAAKRVQPAEGADGPQRSAMTLPRPSLLSSIKRSLNRELF